MSERRQLDADEPSGSITAIPADVCLTLLMRGGVGRVAFIGADGRQELMPVNFTVVGDSIYFRTSPTGPLAQLADGLDNVAFGVDGADSSLEQGWNVTVRGEAIHALDPDAPREVDAAGLSQPWAGGDRGQLVRIVIGEIDGRRVSRG